MDVPGWLLKLVIAFLEDRSMILRYKGASSTSKHLPGGGPQGTILGLFLFLILINAAGFDEPPSNVGEIITKVNNRRTAIKYTHEKYVDDLTIAEAIKIKAQIKLSEDPNPTLPTPFRLRTGHVLPPEQSLVHKEVQNLLAYANAHEMQINTRKTKLMLFNPSRTVDIQPEMIIDNEEIEMLEEMKLLGVVITSDLKWRSNTKYITERGYARLWILKRLKRLGCSVEDLLDAYIKQVRCLLEMACPVWHPALTIADSKAIERVQKSAFSIILGDEYQSYSSALDDLNLDTLVARRDSLCLKFAVKSSAHPTHSQWFKKTGDAPDTRNRNLYQPVWTRTNRYKDSPIPFLTQMLNDQPITNK
jgi:hypothetical protein